MGLTGTTILKRIIQYSMGPYKTIWDNAVPCGTILAFTGAFETILDHMGPSGTISDDIRAYVTVQDHTRP